MIYTFYSFKGGVGRSMALANIAELLFCNGLNVLMVDWDLEAPGLERFFPARVEKVQEHPGVIDMLLSYKSKMSRVELKDDEPIHLPYGEVEEYIVDVYPEKGDKEQLLLLPAGKRTGEQFVEYANRVKTFDWQDFYQNWEGELYFEWLRQQFERVAEVVLIDSRTGVTEMSGICTYQLADVVVMFCAAHEQSMDGTLQMAKNFSDPQLKELRRARPLKTLIVPARVEDRAETESLNEFRDKFTKSFSEFIPTELRGAPEFFRQLEIPYIPLYAFEEMIAVRETGKKRSEELEEAYTKLCKVMTDLAPADSVLRESLEVKPPPALPMRVSPKVTKFRVFVASPGDMPDERERLRLVVDELNRTLADSLGHSLELLDWCDVVPTIGRPEQVILDQLKLDAWDIFVGILWTRFGTPPGAIHPETGEPFLFGTEEEFTLAYHSWQSTGRPRILFYRCMRSPQLDKLDASQFQRVQQFFSQFEAEGAHPGLYQSYRTPEEFERRVRSDLTRLILSYSEQLPDERQTALRTEISRLEEKQPLRVPFTNREDELELILSSLAPPYYLLDAPAGYGKTELMGELKRRLEEQGWVCAYAPAGEHSSLLDLANTLAQELSISLRLDPDAKLLGANLASALNRKRKRDITQQGLALLIDLSKGPSFSVRDLLDKFILVIQESLRRLDFFAKKHNRFRVVIAGRFLAGQEEVLSTALPLKILKLTPFDYDVVRDIARDYVADQTDNAIVQISAHVMHLTGGHPGCMARMLEMYRESWLAPDVFLTSYARDIRDIVLREVEDIRNDIRPELRSTLDNLSVFRYLDYGLLRRLISGDAPLIQGYNSEDELADELTRAYLLDWKGRLLRDETTRHLLAIWLRQEVGTEEFSTRCRQAQAICEAQLREPTIQMPEMWAIESMFQSLQQHAGAIQTYQRREEIRQDFFGETVPKALQLLVNNRDALLEQNTLKRTLEADWEFRFTVNYFLRQDQYDDEPYLELQRRIDDFSTMA